MVPACSYLAFWEQRNSYGTRSITVPLLPKPRTQSHNPEHHRQQAERLCTQQQNQTRPLGVRQHHPEALSTELYRLCIVTPKRAAGRKPWGKLSPAASHDLLCQLWNAALWDRVRATPLVGVQPTDRQLHHLLQRHAPLQAARVQGEPGRHARDGLSETDFPGRMATHHSIRT